MSVRLPLAPGKRYQPVRRCIYCGQQGDALTTEHIVPRGLHGNLLLPEASCKACEKITSSFEHRVLRGFMEQGRRAMGISSRHKQHKKSATLPVTFIGADDSTWTKDLPVADGLHVLHLPVFIRPLCLGGISRDGNPESLEVRPVSETIHIGFFEKIILENGAVGVTFAHRIDLWPFARLLAKIAHAYYIAEKGWFAPEESPVLPLIMGRSRLAKQWLGCLDGAHEQLRLPGSKALHLLDIVELTDGDGTICTIVRIKLLSTDAGPTYAVAVRIRQDSA
ncbi:HNH endonuclease [Pseudomonas jilinensis]|uniref:HNH endonuclease 5 domain-containing protein n=1 Tax=Pseudomonas jilinensis TaxID=2078689 RepID=A0A396S1J0_9PSED|nr:hypothetical protein [Pseudomonas jilinensis]RHW22366.1 hypothetical protein C2846_04955 [Pseudomonas jilinensis]